MGIIMRNNVAYSGSGGSETIELSMAEYEVREAAGAIDSDTWYLIYDATDSYNAKKVVYDNAESGMTARTVQGAIDELNSNLCDVHILYEDNTSSGSNTFTGKTLNVDNLSLYKKITIVFKHQYSLTGFQDTKPVSFTRDSNVGTVTTMAYVNDSVKYYLATRNVTVNFDENTIVFSSCSLNGVTNDGKCVPVRIYGEY